MTAVQFREKCSSPSQCARTFACISKLCEDAEIPFLLNADMIDRFPIEAPYSGLHYNSRTLPCQASSESSITGYSAHAVDDARQAFQHGATFLHAQPRI